MPFRNIAERGCLSQILKLNLDKITQYNSSGAGGKPAAIAAVILRS
jgi:hypothetical protein